MALYCRHRRLAGFLNASNGDFIKNHIVPVAIINTSLGKEFAQESFVPQMQRTSSFHQHHPCSAPALLLYNNFFAN